MTSNSTNFNITREKFYDHLARKQKELDLMLTGYLNPV